jgi:hypothetical protein
MTTRTAKQREALDNLLSALTTIRKFKDVRYAIINTPTELLVKLELKEAPDFPIIKIGGRGGFEMPDISTHPPPPDNMAKSAFEACLWGEKYVQRQGSGAARNSPLNNLLWESD